MKITLNQKHSEIMDKVFRVAANTIERYAQTDPENYEPIVAGIVEFAARWPEELYTDDEETLDIMFAAAYEAFPDQSERNEMVELYSNIIEGLHIIGMSR